MRTKREKARGQCFLHRLAPARVRRARRHQIIKLRQPIQLIHPFGMTGARACAAGATAAVAPAAAHSRPGTSARATPLSIRAASSGSMQGPAQQQQPRRVALTAEPQRPAPHRQPPHPRRQVSAAAGEQRGAVAVREDAYQALLGCQVIRSSTQEPLELTSLWGEDERVVLVFGRSYG